VGGAHRDHQQVFEAVGRTLERHLLSIQKLSPGRLRRQRRQKFLAMGKAPAPAREK